MNKEILEEKALLYAFGTLPDAEVEEFEALIRSDQEARAMAHDSQLVNELRALDCPSLKPPFHVYSRIMEQIEEETVPATVPFAEPAPATPTRRNKASQVFAWSGWGIAACVALVFGIRFAGVGGEDPRGETGEASIVLSNLANPRLVAVQPPSDQIGLEDRMLELAGLAEAYWFSREGVPSEQLLEQADADVEEISGGFTIFDRKYQIGFIAVENMPKEPRGKSYHVWARTDDGSKVIRAGALPIGDESRGLFFFDLSSLSENIDSLEGVNFFVTEESTEDPKKPNREMVVLSDI